MVLWWCAAPFVPILELVLHHRNMSQSLQAGSRSFAPVASTVRHFSMQTPPSLYRRASCLLQRRGKPLPPQPLSSRGDCIWGPYSSATKFWRRSYRLSAYRLRSRSAICRISDGSFRYRHQCLGAERPFHTLILELELRATQSKWWFSHHSHTANSVRVVAVKRPSRCASRPIEFDGES
jgi:hypothetical protein